MLVKLKAHPLLQENFGKDLEFYAYSNASTIVTRQQHIIAWRGRDDNYGTYAALLMADAECFFLYPKNKAHRARTSTTFPVPLSLLEVVDAEDQGTRMIVTAIATRRAHASMRVPSAIGSEVYTVAANTSYEVFDTFILTGEAAGTGVSANVLAPWTEDYVNPWELVVGRVTSSDGDALPSSSKGYYVRLYRNKEDGRLLLADGVKAGYNISPNYVQLPATEKEEAIFRIKAHIPFQLQVTADVREILESVLQNNEVAAQLYNHSGDNHASYCMFLVAQGPPNYLAIDPSNVAQVSFLPQSKLVGVLEKGLDPWDNPSRQITSWAKVAKSFLNEQVFNYAPDFERFSTACLATAMEMFAPEESKPELVIVYGAEIAKYYDYNNYMQSQGELGSSCMRAKPAHYFDFYSKNPNQVGLLICRDRNEDKIHGRALVWTDANGKRFIDRRYGTTPAVQSRMLNWAEKQGMTNIWGGRQFQKGEGDCRVIPEHPYHKKYPYMDSMAYLDPETGELTNVEKHGTHATVKDTQGGRQTMPGEKTCAASGKIGPKSKMVQTVSKAHAFAEYVKALRTGQFELADRCTEDGLEGGLISTSEVIRVQKDKEVVATSKTSPLVALTNGGEWLTKDKVVLSPLDGGYIPKHLAVQQSDGGWCLPQTVGHYQAALSRKRINKARKAITVPEAAVAVAA